MNNLFNIRPAKPEEAGLVLDFIKKLAVYEKCADEVVADEATLRHSLFVERSAEVVFAEEDGVVIGFWPRSPWSATVGAWSGFVSIGTNPL